MSHDNHHHQRCQLKDVKIRIEGQYAHLVNSKWFCMQFLSGM